MDRACPGLSFTKSLPRAQSDTQQPIAQSRFLKLCLGQTPEL